MKIIISDDIKDEADVYTTTKQLYQIIDLIHHWGVNPKVFNHPNRLNVKNNGINGYDKEYLPTNQKD